MYSTASFTIQFIIFIIFVSLCLRRGHLKIAEVESRFDNIRHFIDNVQRCGFQLMSQDITTKIFYFLYFKKTKDIKKDAVGVPDFALKPCLYKRR